MQQKAKKMQIPAKIYPKICKIVQKQALFGCKHLFCFYKTVEIDVSTHESVQWLGVPGSL